MNVILFTSAANTSGGSRQALYLAEGLAGRGHNVLFFVPERSALPTLAPDRDFWRFLGKARTWRQSLESAMPGDGPCVVHAFHNAAVKRLAWWGLFWRKRAATAAHRGVIFRPNNPLPYWSPGIDRFLVNSEACGRILRGMGLSARRISYVPNAVPDSRLVPGMPREALRASLNIPPDAPLFLCVGGNKPYKGVKELIEAFARAFPETDADLIPHLVIVGLDPRLWEPLTAELGMSRRIHCLGRTEDVGSYLRAATAFVLPSLSESMPNTLLEAVRAGLPCIGTAVGAVPDILSGAGKTCGLVVPPGNVPALASAMDRMLAEPGLRAELAAGALTEGERYRPEKRLDLVEDIYMELLRDKGLL